MSLTTGTSILLLTRTEGYDLRMRNSVLYSCRRERRVHASRYPVQMREVNSCMYLHQDVLMDDSQFVLATDCPVVTIKLPAGLTPLRQNVSRKVGNPKDF